MALETLSYRRPVLALLLSATALSGPAVAQTASGSPDCQLVDGAVPANCVRDNADLVVEQPVGENASIVVAPPASGQGFSVRVNGQTVTEDARVENVARQVDEVLAEADVQVVFDGLGAAPRLDVEVVGEPRAYTAGAQVTVQSALNYPAYVTRGELRVIDYDARGGRRLLQVVPIDPNGQVTMVVPEGRDLVVVHRVYDAKGRFDETQAVPLSRPDDRVRADGVEDGANTTRISRIPVYGGAVTVTGQGLAPNAQVQTLGETVRPDPSGGFVLQRIVPAGTHDVTVAINGPGQQPLDQTRRIEIPKSEWFSTGIADLTFGQREGNESFNRGRFAFYVDGRTQNGVQITASADTGEGPLDEIFQNLDEKNPESLLNRIDLNDLYPTYGDDSTIVDNTPTDGKFFVRIERDGNYLQWGNDSAQINGNEYVRNERTLYGATGHYATPRTRPNGEAVASFDFYAASPDRLPQRDAFIGTGGSVYFLDRQDISIGTETVSIEVRHPVTGRVLGSRQLVAGVDYHINYIQGVVSLSQPLQSGFVDPSLITDPTTNPEIRLVVQYEFTPTAGDLDGLSYGARAEAWVTDRVRLGFSGLVEQTGIADQTLIGADIRYQLNDNTWVQLDYAESDGPGFGSTISANGGLIVDTVAGAGGSGQAVKLEGRAALSDLGYTADGFVSAYYERRSLGFSSLDFNVTATTGTEELWGVALDARANERVAYRFALDSYENGVGDIERTATGEISVQVNPKLRVDAGLEHLDRRNSTQTGSRTDAAVRLTYEFAENAEIYGYAQGTLARDTLQPNNRIGVGASIAYANGWSVEADVSDGNLGFGARVLAKHQDDLGNSRYLGYELDPSREVTGLTLQGRDQGRFIAGGERIVNDRVRVFGESSYDLFGRDRTLTNAYGLNYTPSERTSFAFTLETGRISGGIDNDFDRYAVSLGGGYQDDALSASARFEYRTEEGTLSGTPVDADTFLVTADLTYKFSEEARIVSRLEHSRTRTDQNSFLDGEYTEFAVGYAFRPILDDKLNVLARYRYVSDMFGQRVDDTDEDGPRQRSHIFSIDALYDLNKNWTLGGKVGYRSTSSSPDETSAFVDNDAYLLAGSLTYHLPHKWDALLELRHFEAIDAGFSETSFLAAGYRHVGNNFKIGLGYNFGTVSDDLSDLVADDRGVFINLLAKF